MQPKDSIEIVLVYRAYIKPVHQPWPNMVVSARGGRMYELREEPDGSIILGPFRDRKNFDLEPVTEAERQAIIKKYKGRHSG